MNARPVTSYPVTGLPLIEPGDDLAAVLIAGLEQCELKPETGDVLVIAQKIVSKAQDRYVRLESVTPSARAIALAEECGKDARQVEVILQESEGIVKVGPGIVIAAHKSGFVMANAGIDQSNIDHEDGERFLLLPEDCDASAADLKEKLDAAFDVSVGVVINDSFGRPWRNGVVGVALGAAGLPALADRVGHKDLFDRDLRVTEIALADEIASAASLVMGQGGEGIPAVLVRGLTFDEPARPASALMRDPERDLFR